MAVSSEHHGFGALRHSNFSFFLLARFCATLAVQMQGVAVGWQVYSLSGNPLDLGLIGLAQFLPFSVLVLVAGQLADRADRRAILFLCYAVECLCGILLLSFTATGQQAVWPVFAVMALYGSARAFMMPTAQAMMPNLVPPQVFANAVALNSSSFQIAILTGPAVGGLLYMLGPEVVYFTVASLLLISQILLLSVCVERRAASSSPASWRTFVEGLHFVWGKPVVLGAISLDLFAVLFGGATALLPAVASDILQVGPAELGLLRTAPGLGAALTALTLAFFPISRRVGRWMFDGVALFGVATILFGLSENLYLSLAALALLGGGDMVSVYIRQMLVQLETPDAIRGRVSAVNSVFIGASNELGEFESGLAAAWLGVAPSIIAGGCATLLVALFWVRGFPALRSMDYFPRPRR
ncbi:MAG: MFS transporter [Proteobacteria bacterium]|nr:MFS transporter [Pseudomonadota bacterium]